MKCGKIVKDLKKYCSFKQEDLALYLQRNILPNYFSKKEIIHVRKGFIYCKGDIPVCLTAHMDMVHKNPPTTFLHDQEQHLLWSPTGIGGDDRCGIYAIVEILKAGYRPSIIFTYDEEIGQIGAGVAAQYLGNLKDQFNFMIEIDRRGYQDSVYYDCDNADFEEYINRFGFTTNWGSYSDICTLAPTFGCAAVNLSSGYFNEHTVSEIIDYEALWQTIEKVKLILDDVQISNKKFEYIESKSYYGSYGYYGKYSWDRYYQGTKNYIDHKITCGCCGVTVDKDALINDKLCPYCSCNIYDFVDSDCPFDETSCEEYCSYCGAIIPANEYNDVHGLCEHCCKSFGIDYDMPSESVGEDDFEYIKCPCCNEWVHESIYDKQEDRCIDCTLENERKRAL